MKTSSSVTELEKVNLRLAKDLRTLESVYNAAQKISSKLLLEDLYEVLINVLSTTFGFKEFALLIFDPATERLRVQITYGFKEGEEICGMTFSMGEGITGKAAATREEIYIPDTAQDPIYLHYKGKKMEEGSFLSIPLVAQDQLVGVMNFSRPGIDEFSITDQRLLGLLAGQIAAAIQNARLYSKTLELALTDELTQVYNRRYFREILDQEWRKTKRFNHPLSLLMIDVDYFKRYNDCFGHPAGDRVLKEMAKLFLRNVREIDSVFRYGGEEFIILLHQANTDDAIKIASKLRDRVRHYPFEHTHEHVKTWEGQPITISIGIANFPDDSVIMEDLVSHADQALYEAKTSGKDKTIAYPHLAIQGSKQNCV